MFDISSSFSFSSFIRECTRLRRLETNDTFELMGCDDPKLGWVFFLNRDIRKCLFTLHLTRQSRNGSSPMSDSASEVKWIVGDRLFISSRNELFRSRFIIMNIIHPMHEFFQTVKSVLGLDIYTSVNSLKFTHSHNCQ
uniref:Uncharacterized protein n=1 Tax=Trichobilharzia regenti TaxID=157069 RepID=A0AA85JIR5_TRIRE|nr:unnamed protein product [Trichobilharzia regenti]